MRFELSGKYLKTLMAVALGVFSLWLASQLQYPTPPAVAVVQTLQGSTMGTSWQIYVAMDVGHSLPPSLAGEVSRLLERLDLEVFSTYSPDSELSRLNATAVGTPLEVSRELQEVLLLARTIHRQSFATFDVSIGALVNLWGFGPQVRQTIPDEPAIKAALSTLNAEGYAVDIGNRTVTRTSEVVLDLSAIAKGYAVDAVVELLQQRGISHYLVEIGGEVRVGGWQQPLKGWTIAVEEPTSGDSQPLALIESAGENFALAGSGDYRNFFEVDGQRYSHELNPRTGRPIDHALTAVTVKAATAAEADAWATAMMVLGPVDGPLLAEQRGMAVYFVIRTEQGWETRYTSAIEPYLRRSLAVPTN